MRRARNSRDFTVPTGTSSTRAISSYDSPSTSLNTTVSRNCSGNSSIARSTSSSTIRSKNVPWGSSSCSSSNTENGSDRKSTRLNSSHTVISYAVFCLKKKKKKKKHNKYKQQHTKSKNEHNTVN